MPVHRERSRSTSPFGAGKRSARARELPAPGSDAHDVTGAMIAQAGAGRPVVADDGHPGVGV